jgi:hypothetical protein
MATASKRPAPALGWISAADRALSDALVYEWALWAVHHRSDGTLRECFRDRYHEDGSPANAPGGVGQPDVDGA